MIAFGIAQSEVKITGLPSKKCYLPPVNQSYTCSELADEFTVQVQPDAACCRSLSVRWYTVQHADLENSAGGPSAILLLH